MSSRTVDLCIAILEDHFGYYGGLVGAELLRQQMPLNILVKQLNGRVSLREAKRSIAVLEQHGLATFEGNNGRMPQYACVPARVLHLAHASRAILLVKTLYSEAAEAIFEDILAQGRTSCSACIRRVSACLDNMPLEKVKEDFVRLAEAQIMMRCDRIDEAAGDTSQCPSFVPEPDPFLMPDVILDDAGSSSTAISSDVRKRKLVPDGGVNATASDSDARILWRINWARMERFFRDALVLDAVVANNNNGSEPLDKSALLAAQLLLKVGEVKSGNHASQSSPISLQDVFRYSKEHDVELTREELDEKLSVIGKDTNSIIRRVGDSGGGLYIINYEKGIEFLCNEHIESAIREKIGDKAVRIYRLLRSRGFIEEEQVEKCAMLSAKETKELCCALMDDSFITTRQLARTNDFAPARTLFLYTVSMPQVLAAMANFTTMMMTNVIRRRMHEREKHEALLDRQLKMEVILSSIANDPNFDEESRKQQMDDVEQAYMTEADRRELERFRRAERRLFSTEIELDKVLFAFRHYQQLRQLRTLEQAQQTPQGRRRRQQQPKILA